MSAVITYLNAKKAGDAHDEETFSANYLHIFLLSTLFFLLLLTSADFFFFL